MPTTVKLLTSADGTKIWAESAGDSSKPAVVFIHGFACTALAFDKQFADQTMLQSLHLVRYEVRGHGRSGMPEAAEAYGSIRYAEDFRAVCEAFSLNKPFVSGWSLGGIIPCDIVTAYGADYLSGIIYTGGFPYRAIHPEVATEYIMGVAGSLVSTDLTVLSKGAEEFAESCVADLSTVSYATKLAWIGGVIVQTPSARLNTLMRTQDETKFLAEGAKTLPVLVIQGSKDLHLVADKLIAKMTEVFSNVETHLLDGVGHAAFYERPEAVNKTVLNFVNRVVS